METLTIAETCDVLRLSRWTLGRLLDDHQLPFVKDNPQRHNAPVHISLDGVRNYINRHTQPGTSTPRTKPMDSDTLPRLFKLEEVAAQTKMPLKTLQVGCRRGEFTHVLCRGGKRYMTREHIDALIEALTTTGKAPAPAADPEAATKARFQRELARKTAPQQRVRGAA